MGIFSGVPCVGDNGSGSCDTTFDIVEVNERPGFETDPSDFDCGGRCTAGTSGGKK